MSDDKPNTACRPGCRIKFREKCLKQRHNKIVKEEHVERDA